MENANHETHCSWFFTVATALFCALYVDVPTSSHGTPDTSFSRSHESTELVRSWFTKSACACTHTDESHAVFRPLRRTRIEPRTCEDHHFVHEGLKANVVRQRCYAKHFFILRVAVEHFKSRRHRCFDFT